MEVKLSQRRNGQDSALSELRRLIGQPAERIKQRRASKAKADLVASRQKEQHILRSAAYRAVALHQDRTLAPDLAGSQHPILQITDRLLGSTDDLAEWLKVSHAMRRYSPTLDAAIRNRRTLEGDLVITSDDDGLVEMLKDFAEQVNVGALEGRSSLKGLNTYLRMISDGSDEYGLCAGEQLLSDNLKEIGRLFVCDSRALTVKDDDEDGLYGLYVTKKASAQVRIDDKPLVQTCSFSYSTDGPWPSSLAWAAVQSVENALRMTESTANMWWRFGSPTLITTQEYDPEAALDMDISATTTTEDDDPGASRAEAVNAPEALILAMNAIHEAMQHRRSGRVSDIGVFVAGGKMRTEVLGGTEVGVLAFLLEHMSLFEAHVILSSETPDWMYPNLVRKGDGLGSDRARLMALIAAAGAHRRNTVRRRLAMEILDLHLILQGDARHLGRYDVTFESSILLDARFDAETDRFEAEAESIRIENAAQKYEDGGARRFQGEAERELEEMGVYNS